jgi:hypothetical protein
MVFLGADLSRLMNDPEVANRPRFYFALPRLVARQLGWNPERTESNWIEANVVGGLEHLIWFAFVANVLVAGRPIWLQVLLLIPVAILTWICWLLALYVNSVVIRLLRGTRVIGDLPNVRVQSVLLGILTTAFALHLVAHDSALALAGLLWAALVSINLLAAAVLVVSDALDPAE